MSLFKNSLNLPVKKNLIEAEIDNPEEVAQWQKISDGYCRNANKPQIFRPQLPLLDNFASLIEDHDDRSALRLNLLLLMADINYAPRKLHVCVEYYKEALMVLNYAENNKLIFHNKALVDGQRAQIDFNAVRFQINKFMSYALMKQRDYHGAVKSASAALADNPNSVKLHILKTYALMHLGKSRECLDYSDSLLEFCEDYGKTLSAEDKMTIAFCRAVSHHALGNEEDGVMEIKEALKNRPAGLTGGIVRSMFRLYGLTLKARCFVKENDR